MGGAWCYLMLPLSPPPSCGECRCRAQESRAEQSKGARVFARRRLPSADHTSRWHRWEGRNEAIAAPPRRPRHAPLHSLSLSLSLHSSLCCRSSAVALFSTHTQRHLTAPLRSTTLATHHRADRTTTAARSDPCLSSRCAACTPRRRAPIPLLHPPRVFLCVCRLRLRSNDRRENGSQVIHTPASSFLLSPLGLCAASFVSLVGRAAARIAPGSVAVAEPVDQRLFLRRFVSARSETARRSRPTRTRRRVVRSVPALFWLRSAGWDAVRRGAHKRKLLRDNQRQMEMLFIAKRKPAAGGHDDNEEAVENPKR